MRTNSDRSGRGYFGDVSNVYDEGRPAMPSEGVQAILELAQLNIGDTVVEAGCGSGQLTGALLQRGLRVVAVELAGSFSALCRQRYPDESRLRLITGEFEATEPDQAVSAVVSANAFHWFETPASYETARRWLRPGGSLVLTWSCPVLKPELQGRLSEVLRERYVPAEWDSHYWLSSLYDSQVAGLADLQQSSDFESAQTWSAFLPVRQTAISFAKNVLSYHCVGGYVEAARRGALVEDIIALTGGNHVEYVEYSYLWCARARD
jgi:SAM-dependent methyltransferase